MLLELKINFHQSIKVELDVQLQNVIMNPALILLLIQNKISK